MSLQDRLSSGVKATFGANLIRVAANGVLIIVLTRYLMTPAEYGLLFYGLSILGVVAIFGTLGLPSSLARYVTEYDETAPGQVPHILTASLAALLVLSVGIGIVVTLGSPWLAGRLGEPGLAPILALGVAYLTLKTLVKYLVSVYQGLNRVTYSALVRSTSSIVRVLAAIALVVLGFGAVGAFAGYLVGFAAGVTVGFVCLYRRFYTAYDRAPAREEGLLRRIVEYSVPLTATRGASVLDKKVDTVLVGALLNPAAVSFYTISKQVGEVAITPAQSLGFTISPTFGEQKAGDSADRAARLYEQSLEHVLLLYVPATVGLFLVAEPLVRHVFGQAYLGAAPVLQVMSLYVLVNAVSKITSDGLDFLGQASERAKVKTAMAVANFVLNLLFIPAFGVVGAAMATVLTYTVYTLANVYIIGQELPIRFTETVGTLSGITAVSVVMGVGVFTTRPYISGVPTLLAVVGFGVALWGTLATVGGLLDLRRIVALLT
jgi:O-antigen/teichoic acid export membrane protein